MDRRSFLKGFTALVAVSAVPKVVVETVIQVRPSGFNTPVNEHLIRSNIYNRQIKEMLLDELNAMKFTEILDDQ